MSDQYSQDCRSFVRSSIAKLAKLKKKKKKKNRALHWVDFFCGGGLASYGARTAGFKIASGVDNDPDALKAYRRNFTDARTIDLKLGPLDDKDDKIPWPDPANPRVHLHLSPPCQDLSIAKAGARDGSSSGAILLRWSAEQAVQRGYASWSIETVNSPKSRAIVASLLRAHPERVASCTVDTANYGTPQSRVRIVLGPPDLINRLRATPCPPRQSIRAAYQAQGVSVVAPWVKTNSSPPTLRSVEDVAPTCVASRALMWCDHAGKTVKCHTSTDTRILMGLAPDYLLSGRHYTDQRILGNGVPPQLAAAIARASVAALPNA